ncbi:MAG: lycopene cyclase domain-containing protein [Chloroflexi bacterium]|nr:lycopene cyclase domain-containing protein [Chloroflexota bacterium]
MWYYRRLLLLTIVPTTLYLAFADSLAINWGTWTIDPQQSLNLFIGNLPVEEFIFFLLTNTLLVFGMTLALAAESQPPFAVLQSAANLQKNPADNHLKQLTPVCQLQK